MKFRKTLSAFAAVAVTAAVAYAANIPLITGPQDVSNLNNTLNTLINSINSGITPASMGGLTNYRNILDNGGMVIQQRGVGATQGLCGTTGGVAITSYSADRWGCNSNSANTATMVPITATPSPPVDFVASVKLARTVGTALIPVCMYQEIPSADVTPLGGQTLMLSAYIQALAGLAADQGSTTQTATLNIITGTGTDQGLGVLRSAVGMTGSAITPVWTGVAILQATTAALPVTPAWNRYNGLPIALPTTATEMAVAICFTPTAAGAGATDGIAVTGVQLEVLGPNSTAPSAFEFRPKGVEQTKVERYFTAVAEPASGVQTAIFGTATAATTAAMTYKFPVTMDIAPVFQVFGTALGATTWTNKCGAVNNVLATTFFVTATANTPSGASATATSTGATAGFGCTLTGAGGGNILSWSADF